MPLRRFLKKIIPNNPDGQLQKYTDHPNPYLRIFPGHIDAGSQLRESIDWKGLAIKSPYIIFITGRCGSTLLTTLISETRLAGSPQEFLNFDAASRLNDSIKAQTVTAYLHHLASSKSFGGFFGFEIDWTQLRFFAPLVDFDKLFPSDTTKSLYMTRRDIVSQAWSFATAKKTGLWHKKTSELWTDAHRQLPVLCDDDIWSEIFLILDAEKQLEYFFQAHDIHPMRFDYEGLISDKRAVVGEVLLHIGCDIPSIVAKTSQPAERLEKLGNINYENFLAFKRKYADLLLEVDNLRGSDWSSIKRSLIMFR
ncbi:MAG: Stf0 family sulfotransferase [Cyanobacteriota bacterium]|jgi:LPS sulfotransferase NodH